MKVPAPRIVRCHERIANRLVGLCVFGFDVVEFDGSGKFLFKTQILHQDPGPVARTAPDVTNFYPLHVIRPPLF